MRFKTSFGRTHSKSFYPISIYDDRIGFHHIFSFTHEYIARNDDLLMYIPIKLVRVKDFPRNKRCAPSYSQTQTMCVKRNL